MKWLERLRDADLPRAVAFSLLAHLLVLGAVMFSWSSQPELTSVREIPPHVQAVVMEKPQPAPKPKPEAEAKPAPEPKPKPEPKQPVKKPEKPASTEKQVTPEFTQPGLEELLAREELELSEPARSKTPEEQEAPAQEGDALEDREELAEYVAAIRSKVARHWTRPPGARNYMRTVLRIRLLPDGEVLDVTVIESSGNAAMDRSTVAAVKNASPLPVPSGELFNDHFRVFSIGFQPEDLRL